MPPSAALTSPELVSLAKRNDQAPYSLVFEPQTEVGHATITTSPQSAPIGQILIGSASAGWTNQRKDQLVVIKDSGGTVIRGYYRNQQVGDTSNLYIDENDFADTGIIALRNRTDLIQAGDIATIYECYPLFSVKPAVEDAGNILQDGYRAVGTNNTLPDAASYNVTINGQPGDYACKVVQGGTKALIAALTVTPWYPSLAATYTYAWSYPASATGVSGAATATLHLTLPVGSHHIYCDVTDSLNSRLFTIVRWIRICDPSDPPLLCNITAAPGDRSTQRVSVRLIQGRISSIPPLAKCVVFSEGTTTAGLNWGGDDVPSAAHSYCGWLYQQPYKHSPAWYESSAELVGVAGILDMLQAFAVTLQYSTSPATWQDLPRSLTTVQFCAWWILRNRVSNVLNQFNHTPLNTSPTTGFRNLFSIPGNMSILAQLQKVADMYDGNVGDRSDGELIIAPIPSLMVDRTNLVKRATLDNTIYSDIEVTWVRRNVVGLVTWNGYAGQGTQDIQINAQWPGIKTGQGGKTLTATDKVFDGFSNPGRRVGNAGALANNEYPRITLTIPQNWDIFQCADMQYFDIVVPASKSPTGAAITIPAVLLSKNPQGFIGLRKSHQLVFEGLTEGTSGISQVVPAQNANAAGQYSNPIATPFVDTPATFGAPSSAVPNTAKGLIGATQDRFVWRGSTWDDISPDETIRTALGTGIKLLADPSQYQRLILFASQGAAVTDDATVAAPAWRLINLASAQGATWSQPFDFILSDEGWVAEDQAGYVASTGWKAVYVGGGVGLDFSIYVVLPSISTVTSITVTYSATFSGSMSINALRAGSHGVGGGVSNIATGFFTSGGTSASWSGSVQANLLNLRLLYSATAGDQITITSVTVGGSGQNPFGGSGGGSLGEVFIADMVGSPNRQGWFAWLSKKTIAGSDFLFVNSTKDYFAHVFTSVQVAAFVTTMTYGLSISSYNSGANGVGYVTAGDPGGSDAKVYKTTNWFASVSAGAAINIHGGVINVPYAKSGGAANAGSSPQYVAVKGVSTNLQAIDLAGATVTLVAGSSKFPFSNQAINSFTLDGAHLNVVMATGEVYTSDDAGATWSAATALPGGNGNCLNGSPQNYQFLIGAGSSSLAISVDRAATWVDVWSSYDTFRSAAYGSGGTVIITALLDLSLVYQKAITQ